LKRIAFIFGGSGYIGYFLVQKFVQEKVFDKIFIYDIKEPNILFEPHNDEIVSYIEGDVRKKILLEEIDLIDNKNSWIFNLAAVHREPGHDYQEYFDTNIKGANNINSFATEHQILNLFFTSSIAPYGKSLEKRIESSELYPETAYGISKGMAELIHKNWHYENKQRRLIIVRPSVIFGPKDPGNVYRMVSSLRKGTFVLPNGGKVIKAYGYVYGLIESVLFTMDKNDRFILYNYAENPIVPLEEMTRITKAKFGYKKPTISLSVKTLGLIASIFQIFAKLTGKKSDIHPVRVKKAGFPTNIGPQYLIDHNFPFKYDFENALEHWREISPTDFK